MSELTTAMQSELVERVARALSEVGGAVNWPHALKCARAAIEAMPVAEDGATLEMKVLLPPAADCDGDFLNGWIAGQQYLILNYGDEQAFDKAITQDEQITALSAQVAKMQEVLEWYQENVAGCRKLGSIGDPFRHALDADGGKLARAALASQEQTDG